MATGLEALGAASAVLQLISFAGSLASLTMKIYDGIPTAENELEDYATKILDAAKRVQSRQVPIGTSVNNKLSEVSQKCIDAARELEKETQNVTKRYQKQKGKIFKAAYFAFRAEKHRTKVNDLGKSLNRYKEVMETELLLKICDQNTAIAQRQGQNFQSLDSDVQNLILQIAAGHTRIEQILSSEAKATRDAINSHTTEFRAFAVKNISDNQRQRLLKSLKSEDIRDRYNSVLPSSDACFERVFASYERVCRKDPGYKAWDKNERDMDDDSGKESGKVSKRAMLQEEVDEIDLIWELFSSWLQSDDKLFWICGKPGSGKSTLVKFVINNDSTKRLLTSGHSNTRILSYFFWKIGTEPQNSIKGLLCSLLHDLISEDDDAIDKVLWEFKFSQAKDFYKEWSSQEAEKILLTLLDAGVHSTCIFIDGLDEISNKDGYWALLNVVQRLISCQRVKVCVSSRPETELVRRLESIGAQNLRLDDLTKPEMVVYLHKEFEKMPQDRSADLPLEEFTKTLLGKAQGVFLWLALATKSVTNGIENGDDRETLSQRLKELPGELESLYQTMWERLNENNQVYRETAAKYFRFIVADSSSITLWKRTAYIMWSKNNHLVQLSLAVKAEDSSLFSSKTNEKTLSELNALCAATENDIHTRCAGMLQVGRLSTPTFFDGQVPNSIFPLTRPVRFIHRTAHDFLTDTEAGQSILNYKSNNSTLVDTDLKLLKCRLSLANTYHREFEFKTHQRGPIGDCNRLKNKGANPEVIVETLEVIRELSENGALDIRESMSHPIRSFPCVAAYHLTNFEDFVISSFVPTPSPEVATNSLHELALASLYMKLSAMSVRIVRSMIALGADAHVARRSDVLIELTDYKMCATQHTTAFESLICGALNEYLLLDDDISSITSLLDVIEILVQTCPGLRRRVILFLGDHDSWLYHPLSFASFWVALEVDLQFLIKRLLTLADLKNIPTELRRIHKLVASFTKPYARVRHIVRRQRHHRNALCYRALDQEPFLDIIDGFGSGKRFFTFPDHLKALESALDAIDSLTDGSNLPEHSFPLGSFKKVPIEEEMDVLIQEGIGLYRKEDANIS